jgi:hypothetical protein
MNRQRWRRGFVHTLAPQSLRVTAVSASATACVWVHHTRFKLLTDFISWCAVSGA